MIRILKTICLVSLFCLVLLLPAKSEAVNIFGQSCNAASAKNSSVCKDANKQGDNNPVSGQKGIIQTTANIIAAIGGIAAVIIIIFGGIASATAGGGDAEKTKNARKLVTNALIGLVVIALAWSIVSFITQKVISS